MRARLLTTSAVLAAAVVIRTFDIPWLDPVDDAETQVAHQPKRWFVETAGFMQLGYQKQHDVRLTDTAKPPRDLAQLM